MAKLKKVPGYTEVYFKDVMLPGRKSGVKKSDQSYYVRYKDATDGKRKMVFVGHKSDGLTPAKVSGLRLKLMAKVPVKLPGPKKRGNIGAVKLKNAPADSYAAKVDPDSQPADYWTFDHLWKLYIESRGGEGSYSNYATDRANYKRHLGPIIGKLRPAEITPLKQKSVEQQLASKNVTIYGYQAALKKAEREYKAAITSKDRQKKLAKIREVERKIKASRKPLSLSSVRSIMELLRRLCNFGVDNDLCPGPPKRIQLKKVDNEKTEDLSLNQIKALLNACDKDCNQDVADMIRIALFTGLRRGSITSLAWQNINFHKNYIVIKSIRQRGRHSKSGEQIKIRMNEKAKNLLLQRKRLADLNFSEYVFPGLDGGQRIGGGGKAARRIIRAAGLPDNFRPLHGMRHSFATNAYHSGKVGIQVLQKLLGHKTLAMTQRYTHIRNDDLQNAVDVVADIINNAENVTEKQEENPEEKKAG